jgi:uncharacterized repeat protein (TIGR01451 family)
VIPAQAYTAPPPAQEQPVNHSTPTNHQTPNTKHETPNTSSSPPSPALPRDESAAAGNAIEGHAASASHGASDVRERAEFTPNVTRVGHVAPWLPPGLPPSAYTGDPHGMECCADPFYPPHVWHLRRDEFICDGGDQNLLVAVNPDWTVRGLDQEDTIIHYDTYAGETKIKPSNQVCIYAPRFAAVRKTIGLSQTRLRQKSAGVERDEALVQQEDVNGANTVNQPLQPARNIGLDQVVTFQDRNLGVELARLRLVAGLENGFLPYENLQLIKAGQFEQSEKVRLAQAIDAAVVWTDNQAVQVLVDGKQAVVQQGLLAAEVFEQYTPQGQPCMRICKVASKHDALPGEIVHFTLRFDNIGTQEAGNVTIIDHLTTRLEYVEGSAQCSLNANFIATDQAGESLILRWEVIDPIKPGEGGIIRFQCRVR